MKNTLCDVIVVPTGEPRKVTYVGKKNGVAQWRENFPVTREAIKWFNSGKCGYLFITGGYSGFAEKKDREGKPEAQETVEYIMQKGIKPENVFWDGQSLETFGNFTFPIVQPEVGNPRLSDFRNILVIGQEGHMWRIKDYAKKAMGDLVNNKLYFYSVPGKHNNGLMAKVYHAGFMKALEGKHGAEEAHRFLIEEHPFYSEKWYDKSVPIREAEMALTGLGWLAR
jgi:hypothetical protein